MLTQSKNAVNVLFTSIGRRVELMKAFKRAYNELKLSGNIIGLDIDPLAPALREVDCPYLVPRLTSDDYFPALKKIGLKEEVDVVFPLIDPDIPLLAKHRHELESNGTKVAVVSIDSADIAGDKWKTYQFFRQLDLATCQSWLPDQIEQAHVKYPVFIKPRSGSAAKNTFKVNNEKELEFFLGYVSNPIIQEFLPGPEVTNDLICNLKGEILGVSSRQRIEVRWGEVAKGITIKDENIIKGCVKVSAAFGAIGPITIQCMMKEGTYRFTEINARFGGGMPLGIAAGVEAPKWLLASLAGIEIDTPPLGSFKTGLYISRYDSSFFFTQSDYEKIKGCNI